MSYGVQVFNSSGTKILDISDRLSRLAQTGTFSAGDTSSTEATVTVTGMANDDSWIVFVVESGGGTLFTGGTVTKSTNQFTFRGYQGTGTKTYTYYVAKS